MTAAECVRLSELESYVAGSLSDDAAVSLERHIPECSCCLTRLSALLQLDCSESIEDLVKPFPGASEGKARCHSESSSWTAGLPQRADVLSRYKPLRLCGSGGAGVVCGRHGTI